jgi:hypothetical protein
VPAGLGIVQVGIPEQLHPVSEARSSENLVPDGEVGHWSSGPPQSHFLANAAG